MFDLTIVYLAQFSKDFYSHCLRISVRVCFVPKKEEF